MPPTWAILTRVKLIEYLCILRTLATTARVVAEVSLAIITPTCMLETFACAKMFRWKFWDAAVKANSPSQFLPFTLFRENSTIPDIFKKKAFEELRERPELLAQQLENFRLWYLATPSLCCPVDDTFLLAFLRYTHFDCRRAAERLSNFCLFRAHLAPHWFQYRTYGSELTNNFLTSRQFLPLGFTTQGVLCMLFRSAFVNLDKFSCDDLVTWSQIWNDVLMMDQRVQIGGVAFIVDLQGMTEEQVYKMESGKKCQLGAQYFQDALPLHITQFVYCNTPAFLEGDHRIGTRWLSDCNAGKIIIADKDMSNAYEAVPGLKDLMPSEYGGTRGSYEEIWGETEDTIRAISRSLPRFVIDINAGRQAETSSAYTHAKAEVATESHELHV
ncbi:Clavesin-2 [Taenia crassiceps]|uniref:Clavesin-2 n=1 Tax=Taenia crassiceps TaxID=6207 RepID=A0ABR4QSH9_9CEST